MEKFIEISGKQIPFKSNGGTMRKYRTQFGRDLLKDVLKMKPGNDVDLSKMTEEEQAEWATETIDTSVFEDVIWVFAKTADPSIKPVEQWLEEFDEFPLFEIFAQVQELLMKTISTGKR